MPANLFDGLSDDEGDEEEEEGNDEDETEEEKKARIREFEKFVKENKGVSLTPEKTIKFLNSFFRKTLT